MNSKNRKNDPRELPLYSIGEAAAYLHIASATLRSWVAGRRYPTSRGQRFFEPLLGLPDPDDNRLAFTNLVEAHVLWALRTKHGVPVKSVRTALKYAQEECGIQRLLTSPELRTSAGELFLDKYSELINLSKSGQLAVRKLLGMYLERVEWDRRKIPRKLFPFAVGGAGAERVIVIDPYVAFGRPVICRKGISTAAIVDRVDAGESLGEVAADYGLETSEVEEALVYERAA